MSEYTPTTEEVRDSLVYLNKYYARQRADVDVDLLVVESETAAQFDRWLAEYTRVKQAEAWERNSEETEVGGSCSCCGITEVHRPQNPYRKVEGDER